MAARSRAWRIARNVFLILGALAGVLFLIVLPWLFSSLVTTRQFHYPDPNDGKTPISYGLDFRWIEFRSADGVRLKGWYIPAAENPRGTIIFCHGLNRSRVELLAQAQFAHQQNFNGLLFDLRHHGQSEGEMTTLGYQERLDVLGAVRYALDDEKAARPVVLWGISMGAVAALMAADSLEVAAAISDSTFLSFSDTVKHHLKLFLRLPAFPIAYEVIYWTAWRGGFRPADFDLQKAVERIGDRPILFVAVKGDRRMPSSISQTLFATAKSSQKRLLVLPGTRHGEAFKSGEADYKKTVEEFLAQLAAQSSP